MIERFTYDITNRPIVNGFSFGFITRQTIAGIESIIVNRDEIITRDELSNIFSHFTNTFDIHQNVATLS